MKRKKLRSLLRSIICIIVAMVLPEISFVYTPIKVYADELLYEQQKEVYLKNNPLELYIEKEKSKLTGLLSENTERRINELGVFDSEIKDLSEQDLEDLEYSTHLEIYTQYIEYKGNNNETGGYQSRILSKKEVDNLIKEIYLDKETASTMVKSRSKTDSQNTSYLKKTLLVSQSNDLVHIMFTANWLKAPQNRLLDIITLSWIGGTRYIKNNNYYAKLNYDKTTKVVGVGSSSQTESLSENYTNDFYKRWKPNMAAVAFQLPQNKYITGEWSTVMYTYDKIRVVISFWLNKEGKSIDVSADYEHQKKELSMDILKGASFTAKLITIIAAKGKTANYILDAIQALVQGTDVFATNTYYETAGGLPCNIQFKYK